MCCLTDISCIMSNEDVEHGNPCEKRGRLLTSSEECLTLRKRILLGIIATLLLLAGIAGGLLPIIPGTPFAIASILLFWKAAPNQMACICRCRLWQWIRIHRPASIMLKFYKERLSKKCFCENRKN